MLTSYHLINITPSSVLKFISPYEKCMELLQIYITCVSLVSCALVKISTHNVFSPRSIPSVFLGYPHNQKGYKLLNIQTGTMYVSRYVMLYENVFSFLKIEQPSQSLFNASPFVDDFIIVPLSHENSSENNHNIDIQPSIVRPNVDTPVENKSRKSDRIARPPVWQKDFILSNNISADRSLTFTAHLLSNVLILDHLKPNYKHFFSAVLNNIEPKSFHEA